MSNDILSKLPQKPQEQKPPDHAIAIVEHLEKMKKEKRTGIGHVEAKRLEAAIRIGLESQELIIKKSKHPEFENEVRMITVRSVSPSEFLDSFDLAILLAGFDQNYLRSAYSDYESNAKDISYRSSYVVSTVMKARHVALCFQGMVDFDVDLRKLSKLNDSNELGIEKALKKVKNDLDYIEIRNFILKINGLKEVPTDLNSFRPE